MARQPLFGAARMGSRILGRVGTGRVLVHDLHEIVAGKIVALFDRGAARDLFDVWRILAIEGLDRSWIKAAVLALGACNRRDWRGVSKDAIGCDSREFRRNLAICLPRDLFRDAGDVDAWIAQSVELCREGLAFLFELSENERSFLDGVLDRGEVNANLLGVERPPLTNSRRQGAIQTTNESHNSLTSMEPAPMSTPRVVRIVVDGWTHRRRGSDNFSEARVILSRAFASELWPSGVTTFAVTPGGFVRTTLPRAYDGQRGWDSRKCDLDKLIRHAEAAVHAVVRVHILDAARQRTRFLTLGVDLNRDRNKEERIRNAHRCRPSCPEACTHAELVAVFDTHSGEVRHWTGKSYPVDAQQHTLVHVKDLGTHFLELASERLLLLGCHDLLLFAARGRASVHGPTPKEERRQRMIGLAREFEPTMILHHPHTTYSPRVWRGAWGATRGSLPTAEVCASGIAFCGNPKPRNCWQPWQTLDDTRAATTSGNGVSDVVIKGCSR